MPPKKCHPSAARAGCGSAVYPHGSASMQQYGPVTDAVVQLTQLHHGRPVSIGRPEHSQRKLAIHIHHINELWVLGTLPSPPITHEHAMWQHCTPRSRGGTRALQFRVVFDARSSRTTVCGPIRSPLNQLGPLLVPLLPLPPSMFCHLKCASN